MNSMELTDLDGDALTIITHGDDTWITCTSGPEEVTVGPIPSTQLHRVLGMAGDPHRRGSRAVTSAEPRRSHQSPAAPGLRQDPRDRGAGGDAAPTAA